MADGLIQTPPDSTGKKVDTSELTVGVNTVERQRMVIADDLNAAALGKVVNVNPAGTEYGSVVRNIPSGTQPVSGTVTANAGTNLNTSVLLLDATFTGRINTQGQKTMAASTPVVLGSDQSTLPVTTVDRVASGSLTALNQATTISTVGLSSVGVNVAGVWVGTLAFEASIDGTTFFAVNAPPVPSGATVQTTTVNGQWMVWVGGFNLFRARVSAFTSGTFVVNLEGSQADHQIVVNQPTAANLNTTVTGTVAVSSLAGTVDVSDRAARLVGQVEGRAASGAAKAGNPVQVGRVFNTTQPTVTTGQAVEAQSTARGAGIVATGVDPFVANQGTPSAQTAAGWPVQPWGKNPV